MSQPPSPVDEYLIHLCDRADLAFIRAAYRADEPGVMAVDRAGVQQFYSLSTLLSMV